MAKQKCPPAGAPAWVMTFADLMSLLMCFFVLLLSFAQMDITKFKDVAGSMRDAFGDDMVSRTPATLADHADKQFEMDSEADRKDATGERRPGQTPLQADLETLEEVLAKEIQAGIVTIEQGGGKIAVRVEQMNAFPSGSATLLTGFEPVIVKLSSVLADSDAFVHVDGHTDNVPIASGRFRSNWELSAARAASVAIRLLETSNLENSRFEIRGHADAKPLVPNDSAKNRAINRRIEIVLDYDRKPTEVPVTAPDAGADSEDLAPIPDKATTGEPS